MELIKEAAKTRSGDDEASKIGEFYATFMDEKAIEAAGVKPLAPGLEAIGKIADLKGLSAAIGADVRADVDALNATHFSTPNLFGLWVVQGLDDPKHNAAYLLQGGLSMPDREYYVSTEKRMVDLRAQYLAHVTAMLKLAGLADPASKAAAIVQLETKLAQVHATRVESEDVKAVAIWKREELPAKAPGLDWAAFLDAAQLSKQPRFFLWHPKATTGLSALVASQPLEVWKDWLRFHLIQDAARYLSRAFVAEAFAFYGKALNGVPRLQERWERGVDLTDAALGDPIGKLYVKKYFPPEAKAKVEQMAALLLKAFAARIEKLDWMSAGTKAKAK